MPCPIDVPGVAATTTSAPVAIVRIRSCGRAIVPPRYATRVPSGEISGAEPVAPKRVAPVARSLAIIRREPLADWYAIVALAVEATVSSAMRAVTKRATRRRFMTTPAEEQPQTRPRTHAI